MKLTYQPSPIDCLKDKLWRITNLYKIKTKQRGLIHLTPNISQKIMYRDCYNMSPYRYIVAKTRQLGVSTWWLLWWLDDTIFTPNTITGILAHKWDSLVLLWDIIETAYNSMPEGYKPRLGTESKKALQFSDINSKIFISLDIRSAGIHNLHISEWCFCDSFKVRATLGACSKLTNITGESTGNGIGNDGYVTYYEAKRKENGFKARFLPWFIEPEYQLPLLGIEPKQIMDNLKPDESKLKNIMLKDYGLELKPEQIFYRREMVKRLKQDYPPNYPEIEEDCFMSTGEHFFKLKKMMALLNELREYKKDNKFFDVSDDYICFEKPIKHDIYVAGADTSEGMHDYCTLKIINVSKRREAFKFRARCGVQRFYQVCDLWGRTYFNALLAVESNNTGHAVLLGLNDICNYPNIYWQKQDTRIIVKSNAEKKPKIGWQTTGKSRELMLQDLRQGIEGDELQDENNFMPEYTIYDEDFLLETLTFINNNGKFESEDGKFDDEIIAEAICFQMYKNNRRYTAELGGKESVDILVGDKRESSKL